MSGSISPLAVICRYDSSSASGKAASEASASFSARRDPSRSPVEASRSACAVSLAASRPGRGGSASKTRAPSAARPRPLMKRAIFR
jgi:hypothetical protein